MENVDLGRSHLSGVESWPPDPRVASHLKILAEMALQNLSSSGTVLDAGCGDGALARTLAEMRADLRIVGLDIEPHSLWSLPKPENLQFAVGSLDRPPVGQQGFDYVVIKDVLHHLPDPKRSFPEISRLARRGVVVIEANRYNPLSYVWMVRIAKHNHFSRRKLRWVLGTGSGFRSVETHVWPEPLAAPGRFMEKVVNRVSPLHRLANYNVVFVPSGGGALSGGAR